MAKKTFKERVRNTANSVKGRAKTTADKIKKAYDVGYSHGWDGRDAIPNGFGTRYAAVYGYSKGLKHRRRTDKYTATRKKTKK